MEACIHMFLGCLWSLSSLCRINPTEFSSTSRPVSRTLLCRLIVTRFLLESLEADYVFLVHVFQTWSVDLYTFFLVVCGVY